jgi:hypothetical protein
MASSNAMVLDFIKKPAVRFALLGTIAWGVPMALFSAWHLKSQGRFDSFFSTDFALMLLICCSLGVFAGLCIWLTLKKRPATQ